MLFILLSLPALAAADLMTADVAFSVVGASRSAATVTVTPEGGQQPRWTLTIDAGGRRTIRGVPAGRYRVTVATGGRTLESTVALSGGDMLLFDVRLSPGEPRVATVFQSRPAQAGEFTADELGDLPAGNSLTALVDTAAPFVISDRIDGGGLATGDWARVGNRGASWTSSRLLLGDEELDGPNARGLLPFYPDLTGMQAVTLSSGLADPLVATPGAAIALTPMRPGPSRHTAISGAFTTSGMVSAAPSTSVPTIASAEGCRRASLLWRGPLTPRLGAVVSASVESLDGTRRGLATPSPSVASFMTHLVAAPSDRDEVRLFASAQRVSRPFDGAPAVPASSERDGLAGAQLTWDRHDRDGAWRSLTVGFRRAAFTPDAAALAGRTLDRATDGPVPPAASADARRTINARLTLAPANRRAGGLDHSLRLSFEVRHTNASAETLGSSTMAERVAGLPSRVWVTTPASSGSSRQATSTVLTLNDDIAFSPRLTLTMGVRADASTGSAKGAADHIRWSTASPLAVVRWAPDWLTMTAGYRRYARQLSTDLLAFGDPGEPGVDVYRWNDADADRAFSGAERGVLVARAGRAASVASIASGLHPSHTDEFSLRAERRLAGSHYLRVTAAVRHEYEILRSVNVGAPVAAYQAISVPNQIEDAKRARDGQLTVYDRLPATFGKDRYVLSNAPGEGARYRGLEIAWEMRSTRWYSMAGASAFESSGLGGNRGFRVDENDSGVIGELLENPNAASVADSRGYFDRAYVLKWSTVYRDPRDFTAGITARYQDGQPFARMVLVPGLAQGPEIVASDYSVATRFSFTGTIDAHLAKAFTLNGRRLTATLDLFNLSNLADEVEEYDVSGSAFRVSTAMQPTRTIRAGLRVEF